MEATKQQQQHPHYARIRWRCAFLCHKTYGLDNQLAFRVAVVIWLRDSAEVSSMNARNSASSRAEWM